MGLTSIIGDKNENNKKDYLNGTEGNDNINGKTDNDTIYGQAGNDQIYGEDGDDSLFGGDGNDSLFGGFGDDTISGGAGNDQIIGNIGADKLFGNDGNDYINTAGDDCIIDGGAGNDIIVALFGANTISGGDGNDNISVWSDSTVDGGIGNDIITSSFGANTIVGNSGNDVIYVGKNDTVDGGADIDTVVVNDFNSVGNVVLTNVEAITFGKAVNKSNIRMSKSGNDLILSYIDTTNTIKMTGFFLTNTNVLSITGMGSYYSNDSTVSNARKGIFKASDVVYSLDSVAKVNGLKKAGFTYKNIQSVDGKVAGMYEYNKYGQLTAEYEFGNSDTSEVAYAYTGAYEKTSYSYASTNATANPNVKEKFDYIANGVISGYEKKEICSWVYQGTPINNIEVTKIKDGAVFSGVNVDGADVTYSDGSTNTIDFDYAFTDKAHLSSVIFAKTGQTLYSGGTGVINEDMSYLSDTAQYTLMTGVYTSPSAPAFIKLFDATNRLVFEKYFDGTNWNSTVYEYSGTSNKITHEINRVRNDAGVLTKEKNFYYENGQLARIVFYQDTNMDGDYPETDDIDGAVSYISTVNGSTIGSKYADIISGTSSSDALYGGAGNDILQGSGAGNDTLDGGIGADTLIGGIGNDSYYVDSSLDVIVEALNSGEDTVYSSINISSISENIENMTLIGKAINATGNARANTVTGNAYNNVLSGSDNAVDAKKDTLIGGNGNDTYYIYENGINEDSIVEYDGKYTGTDVVLSQVDHTLSANVENLTLLDNAIIGTGNSSNNLIIGNAQDNILDGQGGIDTLIGGDGNDEYYVDQAKDIISDSKIVGYSRRKAIYGDAGVDTVFSAASSYELSAYLENLMLMGTADINGYGNASLNSINGNTGANVLSGGIDTLADTINADDGNDTIYAYGNDLIDAGTGDDTVYVYSTTNTINGGTGSDLVISTVNFDLGTVTSVEDLQLVGKLALTATGTTGNNTITGNAYNNVINGKTGVDSLIGGLGNDTYVYNLNDGNDTIVDSGINTIQFGAGIDINDFAFESIETRVGSDVTYIIYSGKIHIGSDIITLQGDLSGSSYVFSDGTVVNWAKTSFLRGNFTDINDSITDEYSAYYSTNDFMFGYGGNDNLRGFAGNDFINGGSGDDIIDGGIGDDTLIGAAGKDSIIGGIGNDFIKGGGGDDTVDGGVGNDTLIGEAGANTIIGGTGNDVIYSSGTSDSLNGGEGNDTYVISAASIGAYSITEANSTIIDKNGNQVIVAGNDTILSYVNTTSLSAGVENLTLLGSATIGGGNGLNNVITGNSGANTLDGKAGVDTLIGGLGNDIYYVDDEKDVITDLATTYVKGKAVYGNAGTDKVYSTATSYSLSAFVENLVLANGDSDWDADKSIRNGYGNDLGNKIWGNGGANIIDGGAGNDTLYGNEGIDTIYGGLGDDIIYGCQPLHSDTAADVLIGGAGNDTYYLDDTNDVIVETVLLKGKTVDTGGFDTIYAGFNIDLTEAKYKNVENVTFTGSSGLVATGNDGANFLIGNTGANKLMGGKGNDSLFGGNDNLIDALEGGAGNDIYVYKDRGVGNNDTFTEAVDGGADEIYSYSHVNLNDFANIENITLANVSGGTTATLVDEINATGNAGANFIYGNFAKNTITGGAGNDTLVGGAGDDTYNFTTLDGTDIVADGLGSNTIDLGSVDLSKVVIYKNKKDSTLYIDYGTTAAGGDIIKLIAGSTAQIKTNTNTHTISNTQINQIIQHISAFDTNHDGIYSVAEVTAMKTNAAYQANVLAIYSTP